MADPSTRNAGPFKLYRRTWLVTCAGLFSVANLSIRRSHGREGSRSCRYGGGAYGQQRYGGRCTDSTLFNDSFEAR